MDYREMIKNLIDMLIESKSNCTSLNSIKTLKKYQKSLKPSIQVLIELREKELGISNEGEL